jgi:ribonuclease D
VTDPGDVSTALDAELGQESPTGSEHPPPTPLTEPAGGVPRVVETREQLARVAEALSAGEGPFAIDAERASGYRYGQRAYLVQIKRTGGGLHLIDPIATGPLDELQPLLASDTWILHAAGQDLPCLKEIGLHPRTLFDTELAGRLAGCPRVGLGPLVESLLGLALEKGHGAADWSTRPLPEPWLRYAALDVEVLVELRDVLVGMLEEQHKLAWAEEEFAAIVDAPEPPPRIDPWRRTSGLHRVRKPRALAIVRELWVARDGIAQARDVSPGRIIPDSAIVEAALSDAPSADALLAVKGFNGRGARRHLRDWWAAVERGRALPAADLPPATLPHEGPPPARAWADRDPDAAARLSAARAELGQVAERLNLPVENLATPELVRRICWEPPQPADENAIAHRLRAGGAREWQVSVAAPVLARACAVRTATP